MRVGRRPLIGVLTPGWQDRCAAGSTLTAAELLEYLDCLSVRVEVLGIDIITQDGPTGRKLDNFDRAGWADFLDFELPFTPLPGATPIYKDGPVGWHGYYKANSNMLKRCIGPRRWINPGYCLAVSQREQGVTDEAHEYQAVIATWYERFTKAGGTHTLKMPRKPKAEEMGGPISPVDVTKPARKKAAVVLKAAGEQLAEGATSALGLSPRQLKYAAGGVAALAALAILSPYARMLAPRGTP